MSVEIPAPFAMPRSKSSGIPTLRARRAGPGRLQIVWRQGVGERWPPSGTGMRDDPRDSVVDQNLKVHGVDHLHVVSRASIERTGKRTLLCLQSRWLSSLQTTSTTTSTAPPGKWMKLLSSQPGTHDRTFFALRGQSILWCRCFRFRPGRLQCQASASLVRRATVSVIALDTASAVG